MIGLVGGSFLSAFGMLIIAVSVVLPIIARGGVVVGACLTLLGVAAFLQAKRRTPAPVEAKRDRRRHS